MTRPRPTQAQQAGLSTASRSRSDATAGAAAAGIPVGSRIPGQAPPVEAADEPYVPVGWILQLGWPLFGAALALGGLLLSGVPLWRSLVIAITGGLVVFFVVRSLATNPPEWPYDVVLEPTRPYTAWEVSGLEGARQKGPAFQRYLRPRLWELCRELLRRRGIDPDSARAAELVGPAAYDLLSGRDPSAQPDSATVSRLCQIVARLGVDPIPGTPTPIRDRALAGLTGHLRRRPEDPPREGPTR